MDQFNDLEEALTYLGKQGYSHSFTCCPQGWQCKETKEIFSPDELRVEKCHRFHQSRGAHKVAVLYVVAAPNGTKGLIIDNFSTYGNALFGEFLVRMKLYQIPADRRRKA
ncbi:hypothetical protein [Rufibacter sp. XAAS-G3-1]|uniref:hypothetical protein n=1 Tax=Rufibacter sp. XAAS-G3-1 TaxID=2729134 RepID=UPI0015E74803|nr:hypothetical protein [Rufibacter sp. XAAS-G3-1]